jgi:hypothetical protein
VETGCQLKQNLMGSENCEPTLEIVPAKAPPGTSYCGLSFPRSWGRFFALTGRHPRPVFLCSFVHRRAGQSRFKHRLSRTNWIIAIARHTSAGFFVRGVAQNAPFFL